MVYRPTTDTSEQGLEALIVASLTGQTGAMWNGTRAVAETSTPYGGAGYVQGDPRDYDREHALDLVKLLDFLRETQPKIVDGLDLETAGPNRRKLLGRLRSEISKRGVVDVLRKGIQHDR